MNKQLDLFLDDITLLDEIGNANSKDYLLGLRKGIREREDFSEEEKEYYCVMILNKIRREYG